MPNNQIMSMEGQLCGMPLAGPESFSQQQLDYLKRALGVDETVLWTGREVMNNNGTMNLSETVNNFEAIDIYGKVWSTWNEVLFIRITVDSTLTTQQTSVAVSNLGASGAAIRFNQCQLTLNGTSIKISNAAQFSIQGTAVSTGNASAVIDKIVGIHRISGGNQ